MKLAFGCDHRGYKLKVDLIEKVKNKLGYECLDCGCDNEDAAHFPVYAFKVSEMVVKKEADYGIVICGSGDGVCVASNKVQGVRCTLVIKKEDAIRAKAHINANVLAIGSEKTNLDEALLIVKSLIETDYLEGRHQIRLDMIDEYEKEHFN
jgi:ribose 5-phosphate isomerase B